MKNILNYLRITIVFLFRVVILFAGPFVAYSTGEVWSRPEVKIAAWCVTIFMAFYLMKERLFLFGILVFVFGPLSGMEIFGKALSSPFIVLSCAMTGCSIAGYALYKGQQVKQAPNSYSYDDAEGGTILSHFFNGEI